jgi:uncharacterized protein (DUF1697 family)
MRYVAFLRGVNVGGVTVKMTEAKALFESLKLTNVVTVLASGNIIFDSEKGTEESLTRTIEAGLKKKYARDIPVMLRTLNELRSMEQMRPFQGAVTGPATKLYVTFMYEPSRGVRIPDPDASFKIVCIKNMDAFSVVEVSESFGTVDAMTKLSKIFGPKITMRNWSTVQKVLKMA